MDGYMQVSLRRVERLRAALHTHNDRIRSRCDGLDASGYRVWPPLSDPDCRTSRGHCGGYTLLETLIAFTVLMVGVVPLLQVTFPSKQTISAQYRVMAGCLCEQEAARIRAFPQEQTPIKRRKIAGKEWLIRTEVAGSGLKSYTVSATVNGRTWGSLFFYANE
jgi:hypothetical protein